jgi:hypothetical protein
MNEISKKELEYLYVEKQLGARTIARMLGSTQGIINRRLNCYKIPIRPKTPDLENGSVVNGKLIIEKNKNIYTCQCQCGEIQLLNLQSIKISKGFCKNCKDVRGNDSKHWRGVGEISGTFWNTLQKNTIRRNRKLDIDLTYAWELYLKQNRKCTLSGLDINFRKKDQGKFEGTASLDRINSDLDYTKGNCQWIHKNFNIMKKQMSDIEFISMCTYVSDFDRIFYPNKDYEKISKKYYDICKKGAEYRNIDFEIKIEDIEKLYQKQGGVCALSGLPIKYEKIDKNYLKSTASIDRIDSMKSYTKDNIQLVFKMINIMKWKFSQEYFIELCELVANFNKGKYDILNSENLINVKRWQRKRKIK